MASESGLDSGGDHRVSVNENLGGMRRERDLVDEDGDVYQDEQQRDDRKRSARCEVLQRDQTFFSRKFLFDALRHSIIARNSIRIDWVVVVC